MLFLTLQVILCWCCGIVLALPTGIPVVVDSLLGISDGWVQGERANSTDVLNLHLAVQQPAMNDFHQLVVDISSPGHPSYGQHLSKRDVEKMLRPPVAATKAIMEWLKEAGIPSQDIKDEGHWIMFNTSVLSAEALLDTQFHYFHRQDTTQIRTRQYSIPMDLRELVDMIQPTTRFGQPHSQTGLLTVNKRDSDPLPIDQSLLTGYDPDFCNSTITPECIRGLYKMSDFHASPKGATKLGISGFIEQGAQFEDLKKFTSLTSPTIKDYDFSIVGINNGETGQHGVNRAAEADLDIEYGVSLARGTPVVYYSTGGRAPIIPDLDQPSASNGTNEPYLDQLTYLLGLDDKDLPDVLSTSYAEDEESVPYDYAVHVCNLFAQLGARGVSVIFSSGDTGVGSACQSNDGKKTTRFSPSFPATCPFVTAVGGTYAMEPEIAAAFSSGGFSNYFSRPDWQYLTMQWFLHQNGDMNKGYFNGSGRGYPDVAAQAVTYLIWANGVPDFVYGTSCAAPTFAAVISNLNNLRLASGKKKLGFLNPWLYDDGQHGFTDIIHGHSRGCGGIDMYTGRPAGKIEDAKWNTVQGWDPVTGFGTPNFEKLSKMVG